MVAAGGVPDYIFPGAARGGRREITFNNLLTWYNNVFNTRTSTRLGALDHIKAVQSNSAPFFPGDTKKINFLANPRRKVLAAEEDSHCVLRITLDNETSCIDMTPKVISNIYNITQVARHINFKDTTSGLRSSHYLHQLIEAGFNGLDINYEDLIESADICFD